MKRNFGPDDKIDYPIAVVEYKATVIIATQAVKP